MSSLFFFNNHIQNMTSLKSIITATMYTKISKRLYHENISNNQKKFETVFALPAVKYISLINRLKTYQIVGTLISIPGSGALEMASLVPDYTFLTTCYIGLTASALLSVWTLPFRNIIGFLYVTDDNKYIKISCVDNWGKRKDKVVEVDKWIPLLDLPTRTMDPIYLSPQLTDGTKYKLLLKFGKVLNETKLAQVLE